MADQLLHQGQNGGSHKFHLKRVEFSMILRPRGGDAQEAEYEDEQNF